MPVRFRCRHCNQLLGIARRKIGMEVNCPTCHNRVLVPATDAPDVDQPAVRKTDPLFEGSDLDALLQPSFRRGRPLRQPQRPPTAWSPPGSAAGRVNVEPYNPPGPAAGRRLGGPVAVPGHAANRRRGAAPGACFSRPGC